MVTLGERLRQRRYELGIELSEISQKLKIRLPILEALEADEPGELPPVYMRQFARRYGQFLGIPEEELRQLCDQRFGRDTRVWQQQVVKYSSGQTRYQASVHVAQALIYGGLVGASVAVIYYFFLRPQPAPEPSKVTEVVVMQGKPGEQKQFQPQDTVWRLRARARDTVWISVIVDGKQSEQLVLYPGQEREWKVHRAVLLSVGNAGGIELWRDGEMLSPLGPRKAVVRSVRIEKERIWTSAELAPSRDTLLSRRRQAEKQNTLSPSPVITPAPLMPVQTRPQLQNPLPEAQ